MVIKPYEPEKEFIVLFKNKKSEFTRAECLALGIAIWCIRELFPAQYNNRQIFFSQLTISTVNPSKLKHAFTMRHKKEYKAILLEAFFTTHEEDYSPTYRGLEESPSVNLEVVFDQDYLWNVLGFYIEICNYSCYYPYEQYYFDRGRLREEKDDPTIKKNEEVVDKILMAKREKFQAFFKNIYMNIVGPDEDK